MPFNITKQKAPSMSSKFKKISFISPCFNEEKNIGNLIASIKSAVALTPHEIIIVDNGSSDRSVEIANSAGAKTFIVPGVAIGALRNIGAQNADGDLLVFLDADVTISPCWLEQLVHSSQSWPENGLFITGSKVESPPDSSHLEKIWFSKLKKSKNTYVNSAHIITSTAAFDQLSGFSNSLRSGEDYDFCQRAINKNIIVFNDPRIKAFHHDYPKTLLEFSKREIWHGTEDYQSIEKFLQSRTAIASLVNAVFLLFIIVFLFIKPGAVYVPIAAISAFTLFSIFSKLDRPHTIKYLPYQVLVMQIYLFSRTLSIKNALKISKN